MATILDVANSAGVSSATVSNYLSGARPVSKEKRERIAEAIEKLNYIPNISAQNLKKKLLDEIGVILPNFNDTYYIQLLKGIEGYFRRNGMTVNVTVSNDIAEVEIGIIKHFIKKQVAGIILFPCQPENPGFYYKHIIKREVPLTIIDRKIEGLTTNFYGFDNSDALYRLTKMYLEKGYKKIAFLSGIKLYSCENDAMSGYMQAMKEYKVIFNPKLVSKNVKSKESAFSEMVQILEHNTPDAVITTSSNNMQGILEAIYFMGYKPREIQCATLGEDTWDGALNSYEVFKTRRQAITIGKRVAATMLSQIKSPKTAEYEYVVMKDHFNALQNKKTEPATLPKNQPSQIRIMLVDNIQNNIFAKLMSNFTRMTGIKTEVEIVHFSNYLNKLHQYSKEDNLPDVFMVDMPWIYSLVSEGILADISDHINNSAFSKDIYLENCFKYLSEVNGKNYGLPFICVPQIMYYRKDLFESEANRKSYQSRFNNMLRPPRTWGEFNAVCDFFTKTLNPASPVQYGTTIPAAYPECLSPLIHVQLRSCGAEIYNENYRVCFNSAQTNKVYLHLLRALDNDDFSSYSKENKDVLSDFIDGKSAVLISFKSIITKLDDDAKMENKIGYAPIPGNSSILGGWSLCIAESSKKKDESFSFISWACGRRFAKYLTLLTGQSAVAEIFENDELVNLFPWLLSYKDICKTAKPIFPPMSDGREIIPQASIDEILYRSLKTAVEKKMSISDAVKAAHEELEKLFISYGYPQD